MTNVARRSGRPLTLKIALLILGMLGTFTAPALAVALATADVIVSLNFPAGTSSDLVFSLAPAPTGAKIGSGGFDPDPPDTPDVTFVDNRLIFKIGTIGVTSGPADGSARLHSEAQAVLDIENRSGDDLNILVDGTYNYFLRTRAGPNDLALADATFRLIGLPGEAIGFFDSSFGPPGQDRSPTQSPTPFSRILSIPEGATATLTLLGSANVDVRTVCRPPQEGPQGGAQLFQTNDEDCPCTDCLVPVEPASLILLGTGLAGIGAVARRRRRTANRT